MGHRQPIHRPVAFTNTEHNPGMSTLEAELKRARAIDVDEIAEAIERIGFECTRCGACCTSHDDAEHTATVFPDEIRALQDATASEWRDVARPMPFGVHTESEQTSETFEWALQTDQCGDCSFYAESDGVGTCTVHDNRPLICQTYPFSLDLGGTAQPMGSIVDQDGPVQAHECEGLGREISSTAARQLAETLKERAITELEEAIAVRDGYEPVDDEEIVVHDSEGQKRPDGTRIE